jgi:hypothetical protein
VFPHPVVFWRSSREVVARHRNPLFTKELGMSINRSLTVDVLHAVYLGVLNVFCKHTLWVFLASNVWGGLGTFEEALQVRLVVFKSKLHRWYKKRAEEQPLEVLTRVSDITRKMVGDNSERKFKFKGAESWGVFLFLMYELRIHRRVLAGGDKLLAAAESFATMLKIFEDSGVNIAPADLEACWGAYKRFLALTQDFPDMLIPKRHIVLHMLRRIPFFGNPRLYGTWNDESLNKLLKRCCRGVSQCTFELSVLCNMKYLLSKDDKRKAAA